MTPAASLARAVARRNPKAIGIVMIDDDGRHQTVWHTDGNVLELAGAATLLSHEIVHYSNLQRLNAKKLPRRRPSR